MAVDKVWVYAETDAEKVDDGDARDPHQGARARRHGRSDLRRRTDADAVAACVGEHGATKLFVHRRRRRPARAGRGGRDRGSWPASSSPTSILFAQSYDGRDAIARLSVKLDKPVLTNGTSLDGRRRPARSAPRSSAG